MRISSIPILPILLLAAVPVSLSLLPRIDTTSNTGMRANRVLLFRATPYEVRPGDTITLDGSGFSKSKNTIYFSGGNAVTATSTNGSSIRVNVPTNISEGQYNLSVSNILGTSNTDNSKIVVAIKVTSNPQPPPSIQSASISGDTVTVTGSGFTSSNYVITTFGNSSGPLSASGNTITFRLSDLSLYTKIKLAVAGKKHQSSLWIYVTNEHGAVVTPYRLDLFI